MLSLLDKHGHKTDSHKSNLGNCYGTVLILGPGADRNKCWKICFAQICLFPFELDPLPPSVRMQK